MNQDLQVRQAAAGHLTALFQGLGHARQQQDPGALGGLAGGLGQQVEEFLAMPLDMAMVFIDMSTQLAELVLTSLEDAGVILVRGLSPV
jgi:hypothetical protein